MNNNRKKGLAMEAAGNAQEVNGKTLDNEVLDTKGTLRKNFGNVQVGSGMAAQGNLRKNFGTVQVGHR